MAERARSGIAGCQEHLRAIGLIVVNFAMLEHTAAYGVWRLLGGGDDAGECLTSEMSFQKVLHIHGSLFRLTLPSQEKLDELERILAMASEVEGRRNAVVHSVWGLDAQRQGDTVLRIKATAKRSKGLRRQYEVLSVEDLLGIADAAAEAAHLLGVFQLNEIIIPQQRVRS
jgi:hypothetical protein